MRRNVVMRGLVGSSHEMGEKVCSFMLFKGLVMKLRGVSSNNFNWFVQPMSEFYDF